MNSSHHRWLLEQIPQWETDGLLTPEAARTLRARHAVDGSQPSAGQLIMGALGALLIGTGLIAVIGYNWDDFPRSVRLLFAFLPLLGSQVFSFRVLQQGETAAWVRETAGLLQTLATGACIAIVSQIYNLGGEWPDFLFWWMLLSLPLAWLLRSKAAAIFYLIAIAVWSIHQTEHGRPWQDSPQLYPLLLLGLLPYWPGWPPKTALSVSVRWVMTVSAILGLCSAAFFVSMRNDRYYDFMNDEVFTWLWSLTAAVLVLFPLNTAGMAESTGRKPQVVLGSLWLFGYAVAATFSDVGDHLLGGVLQAVKLPWCQGLLVVLAVFVVLAVMRRRWAVLAIASLALLPLFALPFTPEKLESTTILSWLVTLHLAAIGLTLIVLDFVGRPSAPRLGALVLSALIIARMADSHFSLLAKGLIFIAVGVAFLAFNLLMSRRHRQLQSSTPAPALP
ncbi:MAG: DUF2157 domain-containing protein [Prosthecobacter sp.]